jgi:hypothetical protein
VEPAFIEREPMREAPAFSAGSSSVEQPSKFAKEAGPLPKPKPKKGGSLTGFAVFAVVCVIAAVSAFVWTRKDQLFGAASSPANTVAPSAKPSATAKQSAVVSAAPAPTPAAPSAEVVAPVSASAVAPSPSASASASAASSDVPPKDPKTLAVNQGYVFVKTSLDGDAYMGTTHLGAINDWLVAPCGNQFIRIGKPIPNVVVPQWAANPGKPVAIPCQGQTTVDIP